MDIRKKILNNLINNQEVISVNIVGSFTETNNLDTIGDIDVVVICKKLTRKIVKKIISTTRKIKVNGINKNFIINSSFGPLKLTKPNSIPIHLMIYDIKSHIEHVIASPFTCYDWERSKYYKGIPLKKIYPVNRLQLRDFFSVRRSSNEYMNDLKKNRISIRRIVFRKRKVQVKKKYIKIDPRNRGEFVYHIIKFLLINLNKFMTGKNIIIKDKILENFFLKITNNDKKLLTQFKILKKNKKNKIVIYDTKILNLAKKFINKYNLFINRLKNNYQSICVTRHSITRENRQNIFIGSGSDPDIIHKKNNKKLKQNKFDFIFTSQLKRSKSSAVFFSGKKIISNSLLNEINYGKAEGMKFNLFRKKFPKIIKSWERGKNKKFPSGESTYDVMKRVNKFLLLLKKIKGKKKILVISHSFFLRVLIGIILKFDLKKIYKLKLDHLKLFEIIKSNNSFLPNFERREIYKFYRQLND